MDDRERLEKRVAELERQVAAFRGGGLFPARGIRKRADWGIGDIPFYDIAFGADPERGELRGHAKGIIAIGDFATGVLALGGAAVGGAAIGGGALGYYACGGGAHGTHVVDAMHGDPEAEEFFSRYGLEGVCSSGRYRVR